MENRMNRLLSYTKHALSAAPIALTLLIIPLLTGTDVSGQDNQLKLNDQGYFEETGFDVFVFSDQYNGMFFDEKTAGIELIHHGVRTATGGAVRLKPTPEQWDQIPKVVDRKVDKATNTIEVTLRYEEFDFNSRLVVTPKDQGVDISVYLDKPLPAKLKGRAGLNLEFLPSAYFEKTYLMDGQPGIFPLYPSGPMEVKPASTQIRQFAGHSTFDDRGRGEYVEPDPIAVGKTFVLAPEDPERHIEIHSLTGDLRLLDGRNVAQNGWFVVRTLIPSEATGKVAEWNLRAYTIPNWKRTPVIGFSQAGYHPDQQKISVIELDKHDTPLPKASVYQVTASGDEVEKLTGDVEPWGPYLRYQYATFDFSSIKEPGLYIIKYGDQKTNPFPIGPEVHKDIWYKTLDVWFPVQMDHMFVNEAYRVWHGAAHLDDARQAPVNIQHFDGYRMGPSTETKYKPGEHIPGLNVGGWFDAGDYDIRTGSHSSTVMNFVDTWENFKPERDETLVDQDHRYVDIHHPDGKPDILQQIEQGALQLAAQHRAFGRAIPGIIVPHLHQYHHLGDGSTQTDGRLYNPELAPYQTDGFTSGTPDDRWAFTNKTPANNYVSSAALAAASRALRGFNDPLADECLADAEKAWNDEREAPPSPNERGFMAAFRQGAEMSSTLELLIATKDQKYADRFNELIWPALDRSLGRSISAAVRAVPYLDAAYKEKLRPYVVKYKEEADGLYKQNPYGVPITTGGWAGDQTVIRWSATNYYLHKQFPEIFGPEYVYRGLNYILGCHPTSNVSFVSGVGTKSKKIAYGNNRADFTFIAGGVVPGVLVLKPDFPENKLDWPFLWGENEYVIDICSDYIFLANAVDQLLGE
jgi:endoglucanase